MNDHYKCINIIRKQRHDFMNDIQIIYGYLQLEDYHEARKYVEKLSEINNKISEFYSLGDTNMAFCIENMVKNLYYKDIEVDFNIELEKYSKEYFEKDFDKKNEIVNNIITELENSDAKTVFIYTFENGDGEYLLIYNGDSVFQKMMHEKKDCSKYFDFNDVKISKYQCNNEIGFCLKFLSKVKVELWLWITIYKKRGEKECL